MRRFRSPRLPAGRMTTGPLTTKRATGTLSTFRTTAIPTGLTKIAGLIRNTAIAPSTRSRARQSLADCTKPNDERVAALKFLVHFVGEIPQPLHAISRIDPDTGNLDQGGNTIEVTLFDKKTRSYVKTNLH